MEHNEFWALNRKTDQNPKNSGLRAQVRERWWMVGRHPPIRCACAVRPEFWPARPQWKMMLRYLCRFCEFTVLRYVCSVSNSSSHKSDSCLELCFLSLQLVALVAWCGGVCDSGLRQRAQLRARARHKPLGNDVPG